MKAISLGLWALAACAVPAWAQAHDWEYYNNIRYSYAGCYPKDIFTGQGEADAGDGQVFLAADGAKILLYAANRLDDVPAADNLRDEMTSDEAGFFGARGKPVLQVVKANAFTFSGYAGDDIVYQKTLLQDDVFITFEITYPKARRDLYDPLIAPMAKCLMALPPPTPVPDTGK